ncbi:MAG: MurR/RpiR family transcriptional regulator [Paenibacillaceae bacterium]
MIYSQEENTMTNRGRSGGNTIILIQSFMRALTKKEENVAEVVLSQTENVIYYSVTDLAEKADVGETTVLRFCRKIGFKGYQEFKLALAKELVNPMKSLYQEVNDEDSPMAIAKKITATNIQAIQDTFAILDANQLDMAVKVLLSAQKIHFYGVGSSGTTTLDAKFKFLRIGIPVDSFYDAHLQAMAATLLSNHDVAVGISVSGSTKDTVESLTLAKQSGATIICITHYARSPITKIADIVLLIAAKEGPLQGGALSSKIAQLHVIDILCTALSMNMKDKAIEYKEKTAKAVLNKIY